MRVIEFVSMTSELKKILAEKNRAAFLQIFLSILLLHDLTFMTTFFSMVQHVQHIAELRDPDSSSRDEWESAANAADSAARAEIWEEVLRPRRGRNDPWKVVDGSTMGNHRWTGYLLIGCVEHCGTIEVRGGPTVSCTLQLWRLWRKVAAEF